MVEIEVCAYSLESCIAAQEAGANRIELCAAMYDGGTTPPAGMIQLARELLHVELYVMIRPRGGDFLYSELEFRQMERDLLFAKACRVDGVVIGLLDENGGIDVERTRKLVDLAAPMCVTFHRAFDMTADRRQALEDIIRSGCHRILTSGQRNTAVEGLETLRSLVIGGAGRIQLMAGSGVNRENALQIMETGVDAIHLSGKNSRDSNMKFRNPDVFMGGVSGIPEYEVVYSDRGKIEDVIQKVKSGRRSAL